METGEDVAIVFKVRTILKGNQDKTKLKKALQIIGRNHLAKKWEIFIVAGK